MNFCPRHQHFYLLVSVVVACSASSISPFAGANQSSPFFCEQFFDKPSSPAREIERVYVALIRTALSSMFHPADLQSMADRGELFSIPILHPSQAAHVQRAFDRLREMIAMRPDRVEIETRLLAILKTEARAAATTDAVVVRRQSARADADAISTGRVLVRAAAHGNARGGSSHLIRLGTSARFLSIFAKRTRSTESVLKAVLWDETHSHGVDLDLGGLPRLDPARFAASDDGAVIVATSDAGLVLWDGATGAVRGKLPLPVGADGSALDFSGEISGLVVSPDGRYAAAAVRRHGIYVWDLAANTSANSDSAPRLLHPDTEIGNDTIQFSSSSDIRIFRTNGSVVRLALDTGSSRVEHGVVTDPILAGGPKWGSVLRTIFSPDRRWALQIWARETMGGPVASLLLLDAETGARSELTNKDEAGLLGFSVTGKFTADQQAILLNVWGSDFHGVKRLSLAADGLGGDGLAADGLGASKLTNLLAGENIRDQLLSMDGQFLFTIHEDLTLRMWRVDELGQAEGESAHP